VRRFFTSSILVGMLSSGLLLPLAGEDASAQAADTFFAGTVKESTAEKLVIWRTVRGKAESREFRLRPDTKIEGALAPSVRVTVRYVSDDDGDIAILIVVRPPLPARTGKKKKS
jgi:hypothetical protein